MSIDGLTTIEGVAAFLEAEVVGEVPGELRGEVRAAAKLLRNSAVELAVRHREIGAEIADLFGLCEQHAAPEERETVGRLAGQIGGSAVSLPEQEQLRSAVQDLATRIMTRLAAAEDARLGAFLVCLGGHAARRSGWQAVFPSTAEGAWPPRAPDPATVPSTAGARP